MLNSAHPRLTPKGILDREVPGCADSDGAALCSAAHPKQSWWRRWALWVCRARLDPDSLETVEINLNIKGDAPKVTLEQIESLIVMEAYTTGDCFGVERMPDLSCEERLRLVGSLGLLTVCILVLKNGFTVTGESACVSAANFNADMGRKVARGKAVEKIWQLEGYLLREKLHQETLAASGGYS